MILYLIFLYNNKAKPQSPLHYNNYNCALCPMLYALCSVLYALCPMFYALCYMSYALCSVP